MDTDNAESNVPIVVVSKCLGFDACRYNGQMVEDDFVKRLRDHVHFIPVCPEVEIGLGIPRFPVRVVSGQGKHLLIQPATGADVTTAMDTFSEKTLSGIQSVEGFILKNRSPSCGPGDVKVYRHSDKSDVAEKASGIFAAYVLKTVPGAAVEDEGRLKNYRLREHFLTKIYTLGRFRKMKEQQKAGALVTFHATHKFLLMAYSQKELRILGKVVANHEKRRISDQLDLYEKHLHEALKTVPRRSSMINVLQHMAGFFSKESSKREKEFFGETLGLYREGRIPLSSVMTVIKTWALRDENEYLLDQLILEP